MTKKTTDLDLINQFILGTGAYRSKRNRERALYLNRVEGGQNVLYQPLPPDIIQRSKKRIVKETIHAFMHEKNKWIEGVQLYFRPQWNPEILCTHITSIRPIPKSLVVDRKQIETNIRKTNKRLKAQKNNP